MIPRIASLPEPVPLYAAFCAELRARGFDGDLSEGFGDRTVLATDNSIYQLMPQAVAFPRSTDDLVRIARAARRPALRRGEDRRRAAAARARTASR